MCQITRSQNSISSFTYETINGVEVAYSAPDFVYHLPARYYYTLADKASAEKLANKESDGMLSS